MNTQNSTLTAPATTLLPQVGESLPQFASKEEYLTFVSNCKEIYRYISLCRRSDTLAHRLTPMPDSKKRTARENIQKVMLEQLKKVDPVIKQYVDSQSTWRSTWTINAENTLNPRTKERQLFGSDALVNWILVLRRESKKLAGVRMQSERAAQPVTA